MSRLDQTSLQEFRYLLIKIEIEEGVNFMKRNCLLGSLGCFDIELKLVSMRAF